jgi:hypothetical protein
MPKHSPLTCWKVHVRSLFEEIIKGSGQSIYKLPLHMTHGLLLEVAEAASRINDPELNALMCKLALYAISDPYDKEHYDSKQMGRILIKADRIKRQRANQHVRKVGTEPSNPGKTTRHRQANRPKAPAGQTK